MCLKLAWDIVSEVDQFKIYREIMKKILFVFCTSILIPFQTNANDSFFVGIDVNHSHAKHTTSVEARFDEISWFDVDYQSKPKTDKKNIGFGFSGGYKKSFDKVFLSPEIFFDQLNNRAEDPAAYDTNLKGTTTDEQAKKQNVLILNYRYGAKLNAGFIIAEKFNAFVSAGLAFTDYDVQWNDGHPNALGFGQSSYGSRKLAPIYGIGLSYDITDNVFVKTTYDHQSFNIRYNLDGWRSKVNLNVFKI